MGTADNRKNRHAGPQLRKGYSTQHLCRRGGFEFNPGQQGKCMRCKEGELQHSADSQLLVPILQADTGLQPYAAVPQKLQDTGPERGPNFQDNHISIRHICKEICPHCRMGLEAHMLTHIPGVQVQDGGKFKPRSHRAHAD